MKERPLTGSEARNLIMSDTCSFVARSTKTDSHYIYKVETDGEGRRFVSTKRGVIANSGYHYLGVLSDEGNVVITPASPYCDREEVVVAASYACRAMFNGIIPNGLEIIRLSGSLQETKADHIPAAVMRAVNLESLLAA